MDIEITTTKKKLSKSSLDQMFRGETKQVLSGCNVLGFLVGVVKNLNRAVLIESKGEYYILATNWMKYEKTISRKTGQWNRKVGNFYQTMKFDTVEGCSSFWWLLQYVLDKATTHIYI